MSISDASILCTASGEKHNKNPFPVYGVYTPGISPRKYRPICNIKEVPLFLNSLPPIN